MAENSRIYTLEVRTFSGSALRRNVPHDEELKTAHLRWIFKCI